MNVFSEIRDVLFSPYFAVFVFGAIVFGIAFLQKGRMKESKLSPVTAGAIIVVFLLLIAAIPAYQWITTPPEDPIPPEGGGVVAGSGTPGSGTPKTKSGDAGKKKE